MFGGWRDRVQARTDYAAGRDAPPLASPDYWNERRIVDTETAIGGAAVAVIGAVMLLAVGLWALLFVIPPLFYLGLMRLAWRRHRIGLPAFMVATLLLGGGVYYVVSRLNDEARLDAEVAGSPDVLNVSAKMIAGHLATEWPAWKRAFMFQAEIDDGLFEFPFVEGRTKYWVSLARGDKPIEGKGPICFKKYAVQAAYVTRDDRNGKEWYGQTRRADWVKSGAPRPICFRRA